MFGRRGGCRGEVDDRAGLGLGLRLKQGGEPQLGPGWLATELKCGVDFDFPLVSASVSKWLEQPRLSWGTTGDWRASMQDNSPETLFSIPIFTAAADQQYMTSCKHPIAG